MSHLKGSSCYSDEEFCDDFAAVYVNKTEVGMTHSKTKDDTYIAYKNKGNLPMG